MMEEFVIPINREELLKSADNNFAVQNEIDFESLSESDISSLIDEISERLKNSDSGGTESQESGHSFSGVWNICDHNNFDPLFYLIKNASNINGDTKSQLFSIFQNCLATAVCQIRDFIQSDVPDDNDTFNKATALRRNALKAYVFLVEWLISTEESLSRKVQSEKIPVVREKGKRGKKKQHEEEAPVEAESKLSVWELESEKEKMLTTLANVLELDLSRLWLLPQPEESFINLFSKLAFQLLENPTNVKSKVIKKCAFTLIALTVKKYSHSLHVVSSMVHLLYKFEHFVTPLVELLDLIVTEFEYPSIVGEVLREISQINPREIAKDITGTKNVSTFLGELTERLPKHVLPFISLLLVHLENESYTMRNGVIQVITYLIHKALQPQDDQEMTAATLNTRDSLLHVLLERFYDVNAFARSKVVQSWSYLCQNKVIPLKLFLAVTERAVGRLEDKAAHVRKNAMQLLTHLLQFNPYSAQLSRSHFEENLKRVEKLLFDKTGKTASELLQMTKETNELDPEDDKQLKSYCYHRDALQFIIEIHKAIPIICELLGSKNSSDVLEAIQFFVTAQHFNIERAKEGLRKMLMLAWSKEPNIREALLNAYVELYLTPPDLNPPNKQLGYLYIAKNLISLTIGATLGELTSLEELLTHLMDTKRIPTQVIDLLWEIFAQKNKDSNASEGCGALMILSMLANADPSIVSDKLNLLINVGLGPRAYRDPVLAKWSCIALQKLSNSSLSKKKPLLLEDKTNKEQTVDSNDQFPQQEEKFKSGDRFKAQHPVFEKLAQLVKDESAVIPMMKWFSAAEQALNTIYCISENPDQLATKIVRDMTKSAAASLLKLRSSDHLPKNDNSMNDLEMENTNQIDQNRKNDNEAISKLTRLFFVVGHVALKQLVYIEEIYKELEKRREKERGDKSVNKDSEPVSKELGNRKSVLRHDNQQRKKQKKRISGDNVQDPEKERTTENEQEAIEKELGHVGSAVDAEIEAARVNMEREVVHRNLLGQFGPLIVKVCANPNGFFNNPLLRASAVLALLKFMTFNISEEVFLEHSEQNLQLLFTILLKDDKDNDYSLLRANIVIALGDLAFRFPNLVEPWTHHMYSRLRDPNPKVRKNTLMVLTHLILNDMIKVEEINRLIKGQISEMAICLEDKEPRISDLARLFFHELSCKGNTIYNILPDAISGLSTSKEVSPDSFKNIMKYLFSFIEKDKQVDSLVEKLCHRFPTSTDPKHWRDIAYCLTLLNYSEKSFKKLSDLFKFYKDAIADETVYESLLAIAAKTRKFAKQELKVILDEFETKVTSCFNVHKENNNVIAKAKQNETKECQKTKTKKRPSKRKSRIVTDNEDNLDDDDDDDEPYSESTSDIELFKVKNDNEEQDTNFIREDDHKEQSDEIEQSTKPNEENEETFKDLTGNENETNSKKSSRQQDSKPSLDRRTRKQSRDQGANEEKSSGENEIKDKNDNKENQNTQPQKEKVAKKTRSKSSRRRKVSKRNDEMDIEVSIEEPGEEGALSSNSTTTTKRSRPVRKAAMRSRQRVIVSDDDDESDEQQQ